MKLVISMQCSIGWSGHRSSQTLIGLLACFERTRKPLLSICLICYDFSGINSKYFEGKPWSIIPNMAVMKRSLNGEEPTFAQSHENQFIMNLNSRCVFGSKCHDQTCGWKLLAKFSTVRSCTNFRVQSDGALWTWKKIKSLPRYEMLLILVTVTGAPDSCARLPVSDIVKPVIANTSSTGICQCKTIRTQRDINVGLGRARGKQRRTWWEFIFFPFISPCSLFRPALRLPLWKHMSIWSMPSIQDQMFSEMRSNTSIHLDFEHGWCHSSMTDFQNQTVLHVELSHNGVSKIRHHSTAQLQTQKEGSLLH